MSSQTPAKKEKTKLDRDVKALDKAVKNEKRYIENFAKSGKTRPNPTPPKPGNVASKRSKRNGQGGSNSLIPDYERVAAALAVPTLNDPVRWSSEFSSAPTAIASPWAIIPAGWNSAGNTTINIPNTDTFGMIFRSAERAAIIYDSNSSAAAMNYQIYGSTSTSDENPTAPATSWNVLVGVTDYNAQYLHTPYAKSTYSYSPHGSTLFAGADGVSPGRYFWLDGNTGLYATTVTQYTNVPEFILDLWTPDGIVSDVYTVVGTTGTANTTLKTPGTAPGYYSVRIKNQTSSGAGYITIQMHITDSGGPICCHRCIPGYDTNVASVNGIRVSAAALMYTNEAADLYKQGKISGFQSPQGTHWTDYVRSGGAFNNVAGSQGSVTTIVSKGMYGFLKPTKPNDFDIQTYIEVDNGVIVDSFYPLDHQSAFIVMYAQVTTSQGQDGYWTISYGLEYQTTDVWRAIMYPTMEKEVFDRALEFLKYLPQFHENPLHFSDIWGAIKKGAKSILKGVVKYGPDVIKVAAAASKLMIL